MSKNYYDWRGADRGLLNSYKYANTLQTVEPTFTPEEMKLNGTEPTYEIDVPQVTEEARKSLNNIKGGK